MADLVLEKSITSLDDINRIHEQAYEEICRQGVQPRMNFLQQFMRIYDHKTQAFVPASGLQTSLLSAELKNLTIEEEPLDIIEYGAMGALIAQDIAQHIPNATLTFVENSSMLLDVCKLRFADEGQRIAYIHENPKDFTQPDTYHAAHFAYNLSGYRDEQKLQMLQGAYRSLRTGGMVMVQEFIWRDDTRLNAMAKRLNTDLATSLGLQTELYQNLIHIPIESELIGYLQQAGFKQILTPFTSLNFVMIIGKKLQ